MEKALALFFFLILQHRSSAIGRSDGTDVNLVRPVREATSQPGTCSVIPQKEAGEELSISCKITNDSCNQARKYFPVVGEEEFSSTASQNLFEFYCSCKCCVNGTKQCGEVQQKELDVASPTASGPVIKRPGTCGVTTEQGSGEEPRVSCKISNDGCNRVEQYLPVLDQGEANSDPGVIEVDCSCKCCINGTRQCGKATGNELDISDSQTTVPVLTGPGTCKGVIDFAKRFCFVPANSCNDALGFRPITKYTFYMFPNWHHRHRHVCNCKCCQTGGESTLKESATCGHEGKTTHTSKLPNTIWGPMWEREPVFCNAHPDPTTLTCIKTTNCSMGNTFVSSYRGNVTIGYCVCACCLKSANPPKFEYVTTGDEGCDMPNFACWQTTGFIPAKYTANTAHTLDAIQQERPCFDAGS